MATTGPGSAGPQAIEAAQAGCDAVIACGGDGTVHDCMQSIVAERCGVALGVLPLGTGNALANDLGLSRNPAIATRSLLEAEPTRIPIGQVEYGEDIGNRQERYFIVTAGAGGDAIMLYRLAAGFKEKFGMVAYYAQALWLFLTHPFPPFEVDYIKPSGVAVHDKVAEVLAVRISHWGGLLRNLAPGARLDNPDLRLVLFHSPHRASFLIYLLGRFLGAKWKGPGVELVDVREAVCRPCTPEAKARVYAEVDGELIGALPVRMRVAPDALTLLIPRCTLRG
jgi:diacylglycerol kinase family enzyme